MSTDIRGRGRRPAVAPGLFGTLQSLRKAGLGYRAIADRLVAQGVVTSKSSVARCLMSQGCYQGRVPSRGIEE